MIVKALSHLSGQATPAFCVHGFSSTQKNSAGKPIFYKFCVYFPSRMRGTCVSVASVPHPGMARESYVLDTDSIRVLRGGHGGVACYIHKRYSYFLRDKNIKSKYWDGLFIDVFGDHLRKPVTIANIYRLPKNNTNSQIQAFCDTIAPIITEISKANTESFLSAIST